MTTFTPDKHMHGLRNLTAYYCAYYKWVGPKNIRAFELRRARVAIMCAAICYRAAKRRHRYGV